MSSHVLTISARYKPLAGYFLVAIISNATFGLELLLLLFTYVENCHYIKKRGVFSQPNSKSLELSISFNVCCNFKMGEDRCLIHRTLCSDVRVWYRRNDMCSISIYAHQMKFDLDRVDKHAKAKVRHARLRADVTALSKMNRVLILIRFGLLSASQANWLNVLCFRSSSA